MTSLPGLHLRGSTYQLRTIIPLAVRQHFGGRAKISQTLHTSDRREAKASGTALRASLLARFEELRRGHSAPLPPPVLPIQHSPVRAEASSPAPAVRPTDSLQAWSSQGLAEPHAEATTASTIAPDSAASATLPSGIQPGESDHTEPSCAHPRPHWTLRAVHAKWKDFELRSADATRANELALEDMESWLGTKEFGLKGITRQMGVDFKSWLIRKVEIGDCAGKTAHMRLVNVCALLRFAHQELEVIPRQPWRGLSIDYKTKSPRRPWSDRALQAFFSQPLFQAYALPRQTKAGADAAYWIPLLGLYSGATVSELAQLRVSDIEVNAKGDAFVHFTDAGQGQQLKTEQRARVVPLHSELVRLGFLDYVNRVRHAGHESVWPQLPLREGKPGGYFSQWFNEFRKAVEGVDVPDFHSLRHTVRSLMTEADFDAHIQDRITGHGVRGSAGVRVYTHPTLSLRRAIESIRYEAISIPRAYGGCGSEPKDRLG